MRVKNTVVILISSPGSATHFVTSLLTKKTASGKWIFFVCSVGEACGTCLRKGILKCDHVMASNPPHLSAMANEKAMALYDDQAQMNRELLAMPDSNEQYIFKPFADQLNTLMLTDINGHRFKSEVQVVYSFHDPSGGGDSNSTVWTFAPDDGGLCVCVGMDMAERNETPEGWHNSDDMLYRHYDSLRIHPRYRNAVIVIAIEVGGNTDIANRLGLQLAKRYGNAVFIPRAQKKHPHWYGVVTGPQEKRNWVRHLTRLYEEERIRFAPDLIGANMDMLKETLLDETRRYAKHLRVTGEDESFQTFHWSFDAKAGNKQDDMITAQLGALWEREVLLADPQCEFIRRMREERRLLL